MRARGAGAGRRSAAFARGCYRLLARTPVAFALGSRPVQRLRDRLIQMSVDDVLEVLDALERAGIAAWVAGGWGIDALLGEVTRRHGDLDVVVDLGSEAQVGLVLCALGYRTVVARADAGRWMPLARVLRDHAGRTVELLPVPTNPRSGVEGLFSGPGAFALGTLGGRNVRCLSAATQLRVHEGYEPTEADRLDVSRVCERFGLALPDAYLTPAAVGPGVFP